VEGRRREEGMATVEGRRGLCGRGGGAHGEMAARGDGCAGSRRHRRWEEAARGCGGRRGEGRRRKERGEGATVERRPAQ
jgi:hypothetical protein